MKKVSKIILMFFISFIISGCSATYNLEYNKDGIKETLLINDQIDDLEMAQGRYFPSPVDYNVLVPDDDFSQIDEGTPIYEQDFVKTSDGYQIKYSYDKHSNKTLPTSNIVRTGFASASDVVHGTTRQLSTSNGMLAFRAYPELSSVIINIKTDYEVLSNNADSVNGNVYTWTFTKDDVDKNIYLITNVANISDKKDDVKEEESTNSSKKEKKNTSPVVVLLFLGAFIIVLLFLFKIKK